MSLYNQILGVHPFAKQLLSILGLNVSEYGRLRDVYLKKKDEKLVIIVFTRNGGGNRETFETEVFEKLRKLPNYLCDYDDDFDSTYAYIEFSIPEKFIEVTEEIYQIAPEERGIKLFMQIMDNVNGNSSNPYVNRAVEVSKELVEKILTAFKNNTEEMFKKA